MKLKYFLRGLGSGIVLTALVIALTTKAPSDASIIEKAKELGMISKDEKGLSTTELSKLTGENDEPSKNSEQTDTKGKEKLEKDISTIDKATTEEEKTDPAPPDEATTEEDLKSDDDNKGISKNENSEKEINIESENIMIEIKYGMHSESVSRLLEESKIINSANELNQYMINKGYQTRIQPGIYVMSAQISYDEIIEMIAR